MIDIRAGIGQIGGFMFKFVAVFFAVVNGAPSDRPINVLTYNQQTFQTEEACMQFATSDASMPAREVISQMVAAQRGAVMARLGCQKLEGDSI